MSYRPNESDLMAYLYGELEGPEKQKVEQYLLEHPEMRREMEGFRQVQGLLQGVKDKEVIAPPIFVNESKPDFLRHTPYFKTIISIAASLLLLMLAAKFSNASFSFSGNELKLSFGQPDKTPPVATHQEPALTPQQVQLMIRQSLDSSNASMYANWQQTQQKLEASIRNNLAVNSGKMDQVVRQASTASQEQIQQYVATLQAENMQMVKDYFQLTSAGQKQYIEGLLVDFAKYLQQQRKDDLQLVQTRLNSLEQNTHVFKQETEQILSSIISTVRTPVAVKEVTY